MPRRLLTSCSYDYASDEKIEETNQKVIERLQEIKSETPSHSHCYLSKFVKKDNIGYQNAVNAALDAGINNPKEENNFVFFDLSSSTNVTKVSHLPFYWLSRIIKHCNILIDNLLTFRK